jgi:hypothetical protein
MISSVEVTRPPGVFIVNTIRPASALSARSMARFTYSAVTPWIAPSISAWITTAAMEGVSGARRKISRTVVLKRLKEESRATRLRRDEDRTL